MTRFLKLFNVCKQAGNRSTDLLEFITHKNSRIGRFAETIRRGASKGRSGDSERWFREVAQRLFRDCSESLFRGMIQRDCSERLFEETGLIWNRNSKIKNSKNWFPLRQLWSICVFLRQKLCETTKTRNCNSHCEFHSVQTLSLKANFFSSLFGHFSGSLFSLRFSLLFSLRFSILFMILVSHFWVLVLVSVRKNSPASSPGVHWIAWYNQVGRLFLKEFGNSTNEKVNIMRNNAIRTRRNKVEQEQYKRMNARNRRGWARGGEAAAIKRLCRLLNTSLNTSLNTCLNTGHGVRHRESKNN